MGQRPSEQHLAENGDMIDALQKQLIAAGKADPQYHPRQPPASSRGRGAFPGDHAGQGGQRSRLSGSHNLAPRLWHLTLT